MENEENFTDDGLLDEGTNDNVVSPSPEAAVSTESKQDSLSLAELEAVLGKKFPSKETALKALKDTNSYVGTKRDKIKSEILAEIGEKYIPTDRYNEDLFYARNNQYNDPVIKEVINSMAKANSQTPEQVVNSDSFKKVFEGVTGFAEVQKQKTVLSSNPRIAATRDHLKQASELKSQGNNDAAEQSVLNAVKEAYEL